MITLDFMHVVWHRYSYRTAISVLFHALSLSLLALTQKIKLLFKYVNTF